MRTSTEADQLRTMTDREAVAYWNILQFPGIKTDPEKDERHAAIMDEILTERGIPHRAGARTVTT